MAQATYTPISLYHTTTAAATPSAVNLVAGELALNTTDEKLYFKNTAGTVKLLAANASTGATVSSVAMSVPAFLSVAGSPITSSGTLAVTLSGTALPNTSGGTGQSSAFTQYGVTYASSTSALATTAAGTAGYVLTANASAAPTFQASSGVSTGKSIAMAMIFGF